MSQRTRCLSGDTGETDVYQLHPVQMIGIPSAESRDRCGQRRLRSRCPTGDLIRDGLTQTRSCHCKDPRGAEANCRPPEVTPQEWAANLTTLNSLGSDLLPVDIRSLLKSSIIG